MSAESLTLQQLKDMKQLARLMGATDSITADVIGASSNLSVTAPLPFTIAPIPDLKQIGGDIDGEALYDYSGWSVSLSADGTIVAIGAINNDDDRGHVRVYQLVDGAWTQLGGDIDGEAAGDWSGWSVSLSADGTIVAIGSNYNDGDPTNPKSNSGHVRVYQRDVSNTTIAPLGWTQLGGDIDGEAQSDYSGVSVSLSADGSIVAIGSDYNDGNGADAGHVRVYQFTSGAWTKLGQDIDGEAAGYRSGRSVSLSADGTIVAIGAISNHPFGANSGHVHVYQRDESEALGWKKLGQDIDGEAAGDNSGVSVSLSADGSIVAIGSDYNDGNGADAGHVRVYQWQSYGSWAQLGQDIDGEAAGDRSGYSVSLSADGTIVAIGATHNDGGAQLGFAGHVRVYQWQSYGAWTQLGQDIDGEAAGDQSGYSVSLSADGTAVAIGAPLNDGITTANVYRGHVRVYQVRAPLYDFHISGNATGITGSITAANLSLSRADTLDCNISGSVSQTTVYTTQDGTIVQRDNTMQGLVIEGWIYDWDLDTNPGASHGHDDGYAPSWTTTNLVRYQDYYHNSYTTSDMKTSYWTGVSIYSLLVRGGIVAQALITYSDERIKCEIEDVPDDLALDQIRQIPCRYYHYKDLMKRQEHKTIGFIAQEVKEVLPSAVTNTKDFIPDHNKPGEVTWEEVDETHFMSVSNLNEDVVDGTKIRFMCYTGTHAVFDTDGSLTSPPSENYTEVKEEVVMKDGKFLMKQKYDSIFIYGREVNDKLAVDKFKIFALHHSAIQELDKTVEAQKATIATQQAAIDALMARVAALEGQ